MTAVVEVDPVPWADIIHSIGIKEQTKPPKPRRPVMKLESRSYWAEQAREEYRLFFVVLAMLERPFEQLLWAFDSLDRADLEELVCRIDEAQIRYRRALTTLKTARPIAVALMEGMNQ